MDRAFSPLAVVSVNPGALPQAGMGCAFGAQARPCWSGNDGGEACATEQTWLHPGTKSDLKSGTIEMMRDRLPVGEGAAQ